MTIGLDGLMLTKNKFSKMVEDVVKTSNSSYMDAIIHLCEKNNIEIEDIKKYISPTIKNKLEVEAQNLNFMVEPKGNTLPLGE
jgi:gas vesicle protein